MNKQKIFALAALVLLLALVIWQFFLPRQKQAEVGVELLKNGSFEDATAEGLPASWLPESYIRGEGITEFGLAAGRNGQGIRIVNHSPNDARFAQIIKVLPNTLYRLSGYVKAEAEGGVGANLSVANIYVFSESVFEMDGEWRYLEMYGRTGSNQYEVTLFARLGGYSGEAEGEALFDDLSLMAVSGVPAGYQAENWDKREAAQPQADEEKAAAPLAPWLALIALLSVFLLVSLARTAERENRIPSGDAQKLATWGLPLLLAAAALSRMALAALTPGFPVDIACFTAWANQMAEVGPARFYSTGLFSDYPPGYMLALWPIGIIGQWLGTGATEFMVKLPAIFCDMGIIILLYRVAKQHTNHRAALLLAALYAFSPLPYLAGAAWGQVDSIPALLLMLAVLLIMDKRWRFALPVYVLAVLMKPQALMAGPLGLLALVCDFFWRRDKCWVRDVFIGLAGALVTAAVIALPFFNEEKGLPWLFGLYGNTMSYYHYATVNAANLFFLFGKNWVSVENAAPFLLRLTGILTLFVPVAIYSMQKFNFHGTAKEKLSPALPAVLCLLPALGAFFPMRLSNLGILLMASSLLLVAWRYISGKSAANLPLLAGVLLTLFSILGTMMHERYLFLAAALLTLAFVIKRDRRLLVLLIMISILCFLNSGVVLDRGVRIGGGSGNLSAPEAGLISDSAWLEYILSALSLLTAGFALYLGLKLTNAGTAIQAIMPIQPRAALEERKNRNDWHEAKRPQVRFDRKDALLILLVTALYAALALINLGSLTAPQNPWVAAAEEEPAVLDLGTVHTFKLLYYGGIHWQDSEFLVEVSEDEQNWTEYPAQVRYGDCFAWRTLSGAFSSPDGTVTYNGSPLELNGRYVRLTATGARLTLMEVIAQDAASGENLTFVSKTLSSGALADEQGTLSGPPSWYNSMYFDEIYHGRTAYEQRNALMGLEPNDIYETSHPPLGKLLMTFSVMVFGMTPFGWRFAGALAGILMLPGMYLLGKQLTGKKSLGLFSMLLMTFDFMHFTQTRIATIDSFVTLFIIYAYFFMFRWIAMNHHEMALKKTLWPLFCSGLMMGFAIACKWTGIYAGLGLAMLFFWKLVRNMLAGASASRRSGETLDSPSGGVVLAEAGENEWLRRAAVTCLWCLLFFIAVPAVIYYLSFIPVFISTPGGLTLDKVIRANQGMFNYHSSPGLGADHPWNSPWYEWPLNARPMYYYSGGVRDGTASSILSFGNPLVWWGGLVALVMTALIFIRQHLPMRFRFQPKPIMLKDHRPLILLISFLAQYLPWILVPRGTYIYHYFPSVPFIILCMALLMQYFSEWHEKAARVLKISLVVLAALLFAAFFPYLSGIRVSTAWLDWLKWFPNWLYY